MSRPSKYLSASDRQAAYLERKRKMGFVVLNTMVPKAKKAQIKAYIARVVKDFNKF